MRSSHKLGQLTAGQVLRAENLINAEQVQDMQEESRSTGERVSDIALARGLVTDYDVARAMTRHLQLPMVSAKSYQLDEEVKDLLPAQVLRSHMVLPLDRFGKVLVLATTGDLDEAAVQDLESQSGHHVNFVISPLADLKAVIDDEYPEENLGQEVASRLDELFGS
jgi:type IV pilus assembly protein PilB